MHLNQTRNANAPRAARILRAGLFASLVAALPLQAQETAPAAALGSEAAPTPVPSATVTDTTARPASGDSAGVASLQKVEIVGRRQESYKNDVSFGATKTAAHLNDAPQSVSYVTKELMKDQQMIRTDEMAKNMSGVNQDSDGGYKIRGFKSSRGDRLLNGQRFGSSGRNYQVVWNLERFEIIKGPASALYGNADPGGTVNSVTKKPLATERRSVDFTTGSFNTYRSSMDLTGPLNEEKSLLYRVNLGYENAGSFRDLVYHKNFMIAPSLSFLPTDRTRLNIDLVYTEAEGMTDVGHTIVGASKGINLLSTPISFNVAKPNDVNAENNLYLTASLNHDLSDWLSFNLSYVKHKLSGEEIRHSGSARRYAKDSAGKDIPNLLEVNYGHRNHEDANVHDALTAYAAAEFKLGPTGHQALLGYDYGQSAKLEGANAGFSARGYRNAANNGAIDTYDPKKKSQYLLDSKGNPVPNVPHFNLDAPDYSRANVGDYIINRRTSTAPTMLFMHGVYIQDLITLGPVKALLGLRQEYYADLLNYRKSNEEWTEQFALIPRAGLVWTVVKDWNVFGSYAQGFQPQSSSTVGDPERFGGPFDPKTSYLAEGGIKADLFKRRLAATASAYQITQNNLLVNAGDPVEVDKLRQRGQVQGRGLEMELQGQITPAFSLNANGSLNKTEITRDSDPTKVGLETAASPNVETGLWARYNFLGGALRGLGLGFGASYAGKMRGRPPENPGEVTITLPSYQLFDAALYYNVARVQLALKANNLLDETYWYDGHVEKLYPGAPRHFYTSVAYNF